jgi:predicted DNA-binding WGR domain protein
MSKYTTEDGKVTWTRLVYVVELDPAACDAPGSPCQGRCVGRPVYVGETALERAERLAQHMGGVHSSKWVRRFGIRLNTSLTQHLPEFETEADSIAAEIELGEELRRRGYCVYGAKRKSSEYTSGARD